MTWEPWASSAVQRGGQLSTARTFFVCDFQIASFKIADWHHPRVKHCPAAFFHGHQCGEVVPLNEMPQAGCQSMRWPRPLLQLYWEVVVRHIREAVKKWPHVLCGSGPALKWVTTWPPSPNHMKRIRVFLLQSKIPAHLPPPSSSSHH